MPHPSKQLPSRIPVWVRRRDATVDFVLLTALAEEYAAVARHVGSSAAVSRVPPEEGQVYVYHAADLPVTLSDGENGSYRLILLSVAGMGHVKAQAAANAAMQRWNPRYLFLVGIGGGLAEANVALGDVLVATQLVDYEVQKLRADRSDPRYEVYRSDPLLFQVAAHADEGWRSTIAVARPGAGDPRCHLGPMATGNKVIATRNAIDPHRISWPKLIGVEMEAGGAAGAAYYSSLSPGFFMVRGVSDLADDQKDAQDTNRWRAYACDVAAAYTLALLRSGPVPLASDRPRESSIPAPSKPRSVSPESENVVCATGNGDPEHAAVGIVSGASNRSPGTAFAWSGRPALPRHFVGRARELSALETAVVHGQAPIVIVCAIGGQGKTTLVAKWLSGHEEAGTSQFEQVCYFSAYRFGVEYAGFLEFAVEALQIEGSPLNANAAVLSRHLIELLRRRRTLVVVDGIERWLQGGRSTVDSISEWGDQSRIEADSARGFGHLLQEIVSVRNGSKFVMTTRAIPQVLDNVESDATVQLEGHERGKLAGLDEREGLLLFERLHVAGSDAEKKECVRELEGHPLSITVLAGTLQRLGKTIESRRTVYPLLTSRDEALRSILQQAEALCGSDVRVLQAAAICPEDAPVDAVIHAIDESAEGDKIRLTIGQLEDWGLIALAGPKRNLIQLHPLVRGHFASTIRDARPIHRRLTSYFASLPISDRARSLSRVAARIWSVEHAAASGDYTRALALLIETLLVDSRSSTSVTDEGVRKLTLSTWFQVFGQSAFELEWTRRLATGAPPKIRRVLLNSMVIAAQRCGMTEAADRLIEEALASEGDDDVA